MNLLMQFRDLWKSVPLLYVILQFMSACLFSAENHYLYEEDFNKLKGYQDTPFLNLAYNQLTPGVFNGAPEFGPLFEYLRNKFHIDTVIETGTYHGGTTSFFALVFDRVHTIEVVESEYQIAKKSLNHYPNVECHLGSSEKVLNELLPSLKEKPLLFYLDAHWQDHWPLLEELGEIGKTHKDNCILVVDDFKVPGRTDIPYDSYGKKECSYKYIKNRLNEVFSNYKFYYLIPRSVAARAKFVGLPKQWLRDKVSSSFWTSLTTLRFNFWDHSRNLAQKSSEKGQQSTQ